MATRSSRELVTSNPAAALTNACAIYRPGRPIVAVIAAAIFLP